MLIAEKINSPDIIKSLDNHLKDLLSDILTTLGKTKKISSNILTKNFIFKAVNPAYTRSRLLLDLLKEFYSSINNPQNISIDFITKYCLIIELLNIATKIHDSIEQNAKINTKYKLSTEQAILIGDLIFTISFEYMVSLNNQEILEYFSDTTQEMALQQAILSEYQQANQSSLDPAKLAELVKNKNRPLFDSIIFFFCHIWCQAPDIIKQIRKKVSDFNSSYSK